MVEENIKTKYIGKFGIYSIKAANDKCMEENVKTVIVNNDDTLLEVYDEISDNVVNTVSDNIVAESIYEVSVLFNGVPKRYVISTDGINDKNLNLVVALIVLSDIIGHDEDVVLNVIKSMSVLLKLMLEEIGL